ncbi:hypothetical protein D9611_013448 [Ephemerocybe angulata]|uniref:Uncharacterized protein n=1 Tax=Ephemerocybe angulata TaxID=980116 RepID=A0A8H5BUP3_9AGAR|nr:hypothetical protein D9611_013448 [Tulosesus angulatus]
MLQDIEFFAASASHSLGALERKTDTLLRAFRLWRDRPTKGSLRGYAQDRPRRSPIDPSSPHLHSRAPASVAGIASEHHQVLRRTGTSSKAPANLRKLQLRASKFCPVRLLAHGNSDKLKTSAGEARFEQLIVLAVFPRLRVYVARAVVYPGVLPRFLSGLASFAYTRWHSISAHGLAHARPPCVELSSSMGGLTASQASTPVWRPLCDYMDFFREIGYSFRFFFTRKPHPESVSVVESKSSSIPYQATPSMQYRTVPQQDQRMSFAEAFGIAEYQQHPHHQPRNEVAGNAYPLTARNSDPEERQRLRPAVSPHLEPTFPQQHLKPGVESQRPLSEGEDLDLGYYSSAYEGIEEPQVVYPQQGPQPAYPPQPPQQLQPGYNAAAGARDSFQAWTGPRAL